MGTLRGSAVGAAAVLACSSCAHSQHQPLATTATAAVTSATTAVTAAGVVPSAFASACGHPGATVRISAIPVTIQKKVCDLTGVLVMYGPAGVTVPAAGLAGAQYDASNGASTLYAEVDPKTGDVTIR